MPKLTAERVKRAKPGRYADGGGLYLLVRPAAEGRQSARSWLLRVQVDGKRRDIGLGAFDPRDTRNELVADVPLLHRRLLTLAEAREKAAVLLKFAKAGRDVVAERDRDRGATPTFKEAAIACHAELQAGWAPKHAAAFLSSLEEHAYKPLGAKRVDEIEASHIRDALAPIWQDIPVMARKVRQRISTVLNFAKSSGWRATEAPGRSVTLGLSRQAKGGNFAAMPYRDVPAFVEDIQSKPETMGRNALLFTIFTAARSGEVRSARWSHVDLEHGLWNRPANLMKSREPHSITLNVAAVELLKRLDADRLIKLDGLIFPSSSNKPLSDMTLTKALKTAGAGAYTVHGFRSSFRDWAAEGSIAYASPGSNTPVPIPEAVAEAALAHAVSDKVIAAYRRTTFIAMRRKLLDAWGSYVTGAGQVVQLRIAS